MDDNARGARRSERSLRRCSYAGRVEEAAWPAALSRPAGGRNRAAFFEPAEQGTSARGVRLRRLRTAAVQFGDQVRQRHRLAQLLPALAEVVGNATGPQPSDGTDRS